MGILNITPDPKILVALTRTPMKPIDALCELIDNAIDSFEDIPSVGNQTNEIRVEIPTLGELGRSEESRPFIKVSDNGPGMVPEQLEKALIAGYSGKDWHGNLGLFGLGLNIATGKFARRTRFITATADSQEAILVDLDLNKIVKQRNFNVEFYSKPKSDYFGEDESGTIISLRGRWAEGEENHNFPKRLIQQGPGRVMEMLGRRYASLLRGDSGTKFSIFINNKICTPFEHCAWSARRSVMRRGHQMPIPAKLEFDKLIRTTARCLECGTVMGDDGKCATDESHSGKKPFEHRIRGWIGVQRFDDTSHYGIDLIRRGRAIRVSEKDAFFKFKPDFDDEILDYPIDAGGNYGRIIGEVHLDHVPVGPSKEDFERSSAEWIEAIEFLRGKSSLQPRKPGASENKSPLMQIYTGYRRVRKFGKADLYMTKWQDGPPGEPGKFVRIGREKEAEYYQKFINREKGYYEDDKWYELVDVQAPGDTYTPCPSCDADNPADAEICAFCQSLLKSKKCVNPDCGKDIPPSEKICSHCEYSQEPEGPWTCLVCKHSGNPPDKVECRNCKLPKGTVNQFSEENLMLNSSPDNSLSREIEVTTPDGDKIEKVTLEVRNASLKLGNIHIPAVIIERTAQNVLLFLDRSHPHFSLLSPHYAAAEAAADSILRLSTSITLGARKNEHNLIILTCKILDKYWKQDLVDEPDNVRLDIENLWMDVREKMVASLQDIAVDIFERMSKSQKSDMLSAMKDDNIELGEMTSLKESGRFMLHIPPDAITDIFSEYPDRFLGGNIWRDAWKIPEVPEETAAEMQEQYKKMYLNCLEDCVSFGHYKNPSSLLVHRARLSLRFLEEKLAAE